MRVQDRGLHSLWLLVKTMVGSCEGLIERKGNMIKIVTKDLGETLRGVRTEEGLHYRYHHYSKRPW